jgi:hypothetical protein
MSSDPPKAKINPEAAMGTLGAKVMNSVTGIASKMSNLKKIAEALKSGVVGLREILLSLAIICICVGIVVLVYIIARVVRLRGFALGHSENLEDFMDNFNQDMNTTRKLFMHLSTNRAVFSAGDKNLVDLLQVPKTLKFFQQNEEVIKEKFTTYFQYYDIMKSSFDKMMYSNDIEGFSKGDISGKDVLTALISEINDVRKEVKECIQNSLPLVQRVLFLSTLKEDDFRSGTLANHPDKKAVDLARGYINSAKQVKMSYETFKSYTQQYIDLCIGVSVAHLYFGAYFDDIKDMHNSRRFSFFNFLIILIKPAVKEFIIKRIKKPWQEIFDSKFQRRAFNQFRDSWLRLGETLANLPRMLIGESFTPEKKSSNDEDLVEGFGFIKGLLSIGTFFLTILQLAMKIAWMLSNPIEAVIYLIKLIVGILIGIVLIVIYTILTIPPIIYAVYGIYFFIFYIVVQAVLTLYYMSMFIVIAMFAAILWALDLILGMFQRQSIISKSMRCENIPDLWYTRANIIHDNVYLRSTILCQSKCASRFKPNGVLCVRTDSQEPSYCPQAQVYRIYKGMKLENPYTMGEFKPGLKFYSQSKEMREIEIKRFFAKRQNFLQSCSEYNEPYDFLVKTICANHEYVSLPNENDRKKLKGLCKQIYCHGTPKEDFCYKFDDAKGDDADAENIDQDEVLKRIIKLIILIILSVIIILMFLYNNA